jgi:hypothetical protein
LRIFDIFPMVYKAAIGFGIDFLRLFDRLCYFGCLRTF